MLFDFDLTIPAHTLQSAPAVQVVKLTRGTLSEIRILFPPGPATLVHVVVRDRLFQLMPANSDGDVNFDDAIVVSHMQCELVEVPYELTLIGWAPSTNYEHIITCQFDVQPTKKDTWQDFMNYLMAGQRA